MNTELIVCLFAIGIVAGFTVLMMLADERARGYWVWSVLLLVTSCSTVLLAFHSALSQLPNTSPVVHLQEDDPGWDCHTMGNHVCGSEGAHVAPHP